jgi:hypothetical protein
MKVFQLNIIDFRVTGVFSLLVVIFGAVSFFSGLFFVVEQYYGLFVVSILLFLITVASFVIWLMKQSFKNSITVTSEGLQTSMRGILPWSEIAWCSWEVSKGSPSIHIKRKGANSLRISSNSNSDDNELEELYSTMVAIGQPMAIHFYRNKWNKQLLFSIVILVVLLVVLLSLIG